MIKITNEDNMELMARYEDNYFDLAIVDPPYGINADRMQMGKGKNKNWSGKKNWDNETPGLDYFKNVQRVSKNQIIWGGNYYKLPLTGGWIFWDKERGKDVSFADGELAWTSFLNVIKKAPIRYDGFIGADKVRIHPTQKPVKLYEWLLTNYEKEGDKLLDTHWGSGSIAIACHNLKFDLTGYELDTEYYEAAVKRLEQHRKQLQLF